MRWFIERSAWTAWGGLLGLLLGAILGLALAMELAARERTLVCWRVTESEGIYCANLLPGERRNLIQGRQAL